MPTVSSVVATGRRMNGSDRLVNFMDSRSTPEDRHEDTKDTKKNDRQIESALPS
jgi:hypothetical protein